MSKSLGNVVDPLDIVGAQGADALRFTLATGTTPGQDLNLSLERLESSRNLANKLWNAGKLVLLSLEVLPAEERAALADASFDSAEALASLPLAERLAGEGVRIAGAGLRIVPSTRPRSPGLPARG